MFPIPPTPTCLFDRLNHFVDAFHFIAPQRLLIDNAPESQDVFVYRFKEPVPNLPAVIGGKVDSIHKLNRS